MQEEFMKRLEGKKADYIYLGITEDGKSRLTIPIPWEQTAHAMNMLTPNVYLSKEEVSDPEIMEYLVSHTKVRSCYIFTPLENYEFLSNFAEMEDLEIYGGDHITSLSFMRNMKSWMMLHIENARLKNLEEAFPEDRKIDFFLPMCLSLQACEVEDLKEAVEFTRKKSLAELIICRKKSQRDERERWKEVRTTMYRYYNLKEEF